MEGLERMVSESFARHGVEPAFDYRRVRVVPVVALCRQL